MANSEQVIKISTHLSVLCLGINIEFLYLSRSDLYTYIVFFVANVVICVLQCVFSMPYRIAKMDNDSQRVAHMVL